MKKSIKSLLGFLLAISLVGCSQGETSKGETFSATSNGFGGDVTVTISVLDNKIIDATVEGKDETENVGGAALETLATSMKEVGNCDIDGVSGATVTSTAAKTACSIAFSEATGEELETSLTDGTYTASANGFGLKAKLPVTVTISEGKITAIEVSEENDETACQLENVEELLIPRIIDAQSVGVDSITGATATSNAVKTAVLDCLVQAGGNEATLSAPVAKEEKAPAEYTTDVVVVGFGGAGATAAMAAVEGGAKVIAVDKAGKVGGTSAVTGGPMSVNMPSQVEAEIQDWTDPTTGEKRTKKAGEELVDTEAFIQAWLDYTTVDGKQDAKESIIKEIVPMTGETSEWMTTHGFEFTNAVGFLGNKWAVYTPYVGNKALTQGFFNKLVEDFEAKGGQTILETTITNLVFDNDGNIIGVHGTSDDGTDVTINAKQVILACGGFGGSAEEMEKYLGEDWLLYGMAQNTGEGIEMAISAGAATYNIEMDPMSHFAAPEAITRSFDEAFDNDIPYALVSNGEILVVNKSGERFLNEARTQYSASTGDSRFYTIYSSKQIETLKEKGLSMDAAGRYLNHFGVGGVPTADVPMTNIDAVLSDGIKAGFIYKADTLEDLAKQIHDSKSNGGKMDADTLVANVKAYNEGIETGEDAFGKTSEYFERLGAIDEDAEYYIAVTGAPYIYSTCGGVEVDDDMHVVKEDGTSIQNLYSVGTDSMGVLFTNKKGYANFGGVAQGYVFTSGRIAGTNAAKTLSE